MGWDPINDIRYGVEKERALLAETGLNESAGLMNSLLGTLTGATQEGVDNKRAAIASADAKRTYKKDYELATGKEWTDDLTSGSAARAIKEADKQTGLDDIVTQATTMHELPGAVRRRNVEDRRYYDDKAATAQARLDTLNAQMRSDRRADQRHNESMERLDRADRRKAISGMTGGLAALAAAFAI